MPRSVQVPAIVAAGILVGLGASRLRSVDDSTATHSTSPCVATEQAAISTKPGDLAHHYRTIGKGTPVEVRGQSDDSRSVLYPDSGSTAHGWMRSSDIGTCATSNHPAPTEASLAPIGTPWDEHVLLQGFHWKSNTVKDQQGRPRWYGIIQENTQRIADSGFTLVWFPPPSLSVKQGDHYPGYMPTELYDLNSAYGTEHELRASIRGLRERGIGAIADIVINHRCGSSDWADFRNPFWKTAESICRDDEWDGAKSQNSDLGDGSTACRDLDHKSSTVQDGIKSWMAWLKNDIGFVGWRYDMVKGFPGWAIELYNKSTTPLFSVGEHLDGDAQKVMGWIDSTHPEPSYRSSAFDYPLYFILYDAVVNRKYGHLKYADRSVGIVGMWSDKANLFVMNHDTEPERHGEYAQPIPDDGRMLQAYAFVLVNNGTPSVFWSNIYDSSHETAIREMIWIRKHYRLTSHSQVHIAKAEDGNVFAAYVRGINGELAVKIGPGAWSPEGSQWYPANTKLLTSGDDYAVWGDRGRWW